jgi:outer membrane protein assembly factor BamB
MRKNYALLGLLFTVLCSFAQAPTIAWSYALPDKIDRTAPAIASDGTIYIGINLGSRNTATPPAKPDSNFFAINADGTLKWETSISEGNFTKPDAIISSPSISGDGSIYMGGQYGRIVFRINATTGDTIRTKHINTRMRYTAPAFADNGTVYISGYSKGDKGIRSLSVDLQTENWVFGAGNDFNSTPAVASDGTIYAVSTDDNIYAINPDGTQKWSAMYGDWVASAIAIGTDGTVYLSAKLNAAGDGVLKAYNPTDGSEKWSVSLTGANTEQGGPAVASDGTVYLGNKAGTFKAYNSADGSEKWSYTTTSNGPIEVVAAIDNDGNIYFGDTNGIFYVLKSDGTEAYTPLDLGDKINSPAAIGSNGKVYVGATDAGVGKLYALTTTATSLATSGWPMFGKNSSHTGNVDAVVLSVDQENSIEGFKIYPNPTNNNGFYIETSSNQNKSIQIFDILGKMVFSKNIVGNEKVESLNLKAGIYLIKVFENDKSATSKLIIK